MPATMLSDVCRRTIPRVAMTGAMVAARCLPTSSALRQYKPLGITIEELAKESVSTELKQELLKENSRPCAHPLATENDVKIELGQMMDDKWEDKKRVILMEVDKKIVQEANKRASEVEFWRAKASLPDILRRISELENQVNGQASKPAAPSSYSLASVGSRHTRPSAPHQDPVPSKQHFDELSDKVAAAVDGHGVIKKDVEAVKQGLLDLRGRLIFLEKTPPANQAAAAAAPAAGANQVQSGPCSCSCEDLGALKAEIRNLRKRLDSIQAVETHPDIKKIHDFLVYANCKIDQGDGFFGKIDEEFKKIDQTIKKLSTSIHTAMGSQRRTFAKEINGLKERSKEQKKASEAVGDTAKQQAEAAATDMKIKGLEADKKKLTDEYKTLADQVKAQDETIKAQGRTIKAQVEETDKLKAGQQVQHDSIKELYEMYRRINGASTVQPNGGQQGGDPQLLVSGQQQQGPSANAFQAPAPQGNAPYTPAPSPPDQGNEMDVDGGEGDAEMTDVPRQPAQPHQPHVHQVVPNFVQQPPQQPAQPHQPQAYQVVPKFVQQPPQQPPHQPRAHQVVPNFVQQPPQQPAQPHQPGAHHFIPNFVQQTPQQTPQQPPEQPLQQPPEQPAQPQQPHAHQVVPNFVQQPPQQPPQQHVQQQPLPGSTATPGDTPMANAGPIVPKDNGNAANMGNRGAAQQQPQRIGLGQSILGSGPTKASPNPPSTPKPQKSSQNLFTIPQSPDASSSGPSNHAPAQAPAGAGSAKAPIPSIFSITGPQTSGQPLFSISQSPVITGSGPSKPAPAQTPAAAGSAKAPASPIFKVNLLPPPVGRSNPTWETDVGPMRFSGGPEQSSQPFLGIVPSTPAKKATKKKEPTVFNEHGRPMAIPNKPPSAIGKVHKNQTKAAFLATRNQPASNAQNSPAPANTTPPAPVAPMATHESEDEDEDVVWEDCLLPGAANPSPFAQKPNAPTNTPYISKYAAPNPSFTTIVSDTRPTFDLSKIVVVPETGSGAGAEMSGTENKPETTEAPEHEGMPIEHIHEPELNPRKRVKEQEEPVVESKGDMDMDRKVAKPKGVSQNVDPAKVKETMKRHNVEKSFNVWDNQFNQSGEQDQTDYGDPNDPNDEDTHVTVADFSKRAKKSAQVVKEPTKYSIAFFHTWKTDVRDMFENDVSRLTDGQPTEKVRNRRNAKFQAELDRRDWDYTNRHPLNKLLMHCGLATDAKGYSKDQMTSLLKAWYQNVFVEALIPLRVMSKAGLVDLREKSALGVKQFMENARPDVIV